MATHPDTYSHYPCFVTIFCEHALRRLEEMIPYMNLNEQVDADFSRARRRARLRAVLARIRRERTPNRLLSFDDVRREFSVANNRLHRGRRVVEVDEIVGSVGRWRDFDRSFLPARTSMAERWKRIDRAFQKGEDLPPVE